MRNLVSFIQKCFLKTSSAALSPTSSSSSSFTVQYLINSCGLPSKSALSASQNLQLHENKLPKLQSLLEFLKSHGFDDTQMAKLIEKRPKVLHCRIEDNLKPKFEFLIANGFAGKLLPELIIANPLILRKSLGAHIKPSMELLKSVLDSNEMIVAAIKRTSWLLTYPFKETIEPNIDFLIKEGVPVDRIAKLIILQPRAIYQRHDRMVYAVNCLKDLGFEPNGGMFIHGLRVMIQMSHSTWKKKIEVMKSVGWCEEEILLAFRRCPSVLAASEKKLRSAMDVFVSTMKLSRKAIIAKPFLLRFAIDKRILPRYKVFKILESKKLIKGRKKIFSFITMSEGVFLQNLVTKYVDKVPGILEIYGATSKATKSVT